MTGRSAAFKGEPFKEVKIRDFRFGLRKLYLNEKEKPSIFTYPNAGKGANGESSN